MTEAQADDLQTKIDTKHPDALVILGANRRKFSAHVKSRQVNEMGQLRDVVVSYNRKGSSTVTPVGDWRDIDEAERAKLLRCIGRG